jgi:hypothetical protein
MIGDIVLRAAVDWSEDYTRFTINFPLAELKFKQEKKFNARFEEFVNQFTRLAAAKKQGFEHFQTRSTFRAVRYLLLLGQILKKTEDERDRGNLQQAIAVISAQSAEANEGIALTKNRISCHDYQTDLIHKPGDNFVRFFSSTSLVALTNRSLLNNRTWSYWTNQECFIPRAKFIENRMAVISANGTKLS